MNMHRTQIRRASLVQKVQQHRRIKPATERNPDARARRKWRQLKLPGAQCTSAAMPPQAARAERRRCEEGVVHRTEVAGSAHTRTTLGTARRVRERSPREPCSPTPWTVEGG